MKQQEKQQGKAGATSAPGDGQQEVDFKKLSISDAFSLLNATPAGLSEGQAKQRLEEYGPNKLPESTINPVVRFLGYLWNPLSWAMEVAALLAIILLDGADFALIVGLLLLNATIAFVEESNADKAIKALTSALAPKCKALRDGQLRTMDAADLVPGDVILIRLGDVVPADVKLLGDEEEAAEDETPMQVDQAALTGESLPVKKYTGDVAFSGSTIKQGERHALVYATGVDTFFGKAAALISTTNNTSNIQKVMTRIGAVCLLTIGVWVVIEIGVQFGAYRHLCSTGAGGCPTLSNLLVIIVGGIPIAMPTVLSVTLALGAAQLAREGAIVARMSAVEEMAGMDVLCSDKTGTLTLNQLTVDKDSLLALSGHDTDSVIKHAALSANTATQEAIDVVLFEAHPGKDTLWGDYTLKKFVPFNPVDKFTMAVIQEKGNDRVFRIMKGAPQAVLKHCHNKQALEKAVTDKVNDLASRGYRALGVALAEGEGAATAPGTKWEYVGLVPLFDPPRHDTKATIERCHEQGIQVKMITGDQQAIGIETARQLGMGTNIFKMDALLAAKAGSGLVEGYASVEQLVEQADGFAEVFPEHKFEVVKMLQDLNHMVGMTGDGVNDAPALKKADVGIAVHGATDAARGAADIVLTEPGLSVIVAAVIGARKIFQRMTTYARYTVAMTFRICFTFGLLTVAYNWYFPTILIVLLAVFNDGAMIALSKDRVTPSPVPNMWCLPNIFATGIVYGLYLTLSTWTLFHVASQNTFFEDRIHLFSLNTNQQTLVPFCARLITGLGHLPSAPASRVYPGMDPAITLMDQCVAEQRFVRGAQLRALIYAQVSISGQALVFVTRTMGWSLANRAGTLTYVAFLGAQLAASLMAGFGFGGYETPPQVAPGPCQLCVQSDGQFPAFFGSRQVPVAGTEGEFTASVIGCNMWIFVAWIWSFLWYLPLDPIKWISAWVLNEEGVRSRNAWASWLRTKERCPTKDAAGSMVVGAAPITAANPLGRASLAKAPDAAALERASMMPVARDQSGQMRLSHQVRPHSHGSSSSSNPASRRASVADAKGMEQV